MCKTTKITTVIVNATSNPSAKKSAKVKRTTSPTPLSKSESASQPLPTQQAFHQYLRVQAQSVVRTVIELVMREELEAFLGAVWGECSPKRKGKRLGSYTRDLVTSTGRLEDINVPREREGQFHTQVAGPLPAL
jgi:putative transposase